MPGRRSCFVTFSPEANSNQGQFSGAVIGQVVSPSWKFRTREDKLRLSTKGFIVTVAGSLYDDDMIMFNMGYADLTDLHARSNKWRSRPKSDVDRDAAPGSHFSESSRRPVAKTCQKQTSFRGIMQLALSNAFPHD